MGKVKTSEWFGYDYANRNGWLSTKEHGSPASGYWWTGRFFDPRGIVDVYRQVDHTRLSFGHDGRIYHRSWNTYWGARTINQLSRQFVSDVLEGNV